MPDARPIQLVIINHYHHVRKGRFLPIILPSDAHRIELMTGGRGWFRHEDDWVEATAGMLLWHGPGESTIARCDQKDPYSCLVVHLKFPPDTPRPVPRISLWPQLNEVMALTRQLVRCYVDDRFNHQVLMDYAYDSLLFQAQLYHHFSERSQLPTGLIRVLDVIEHRYHEPLCLEDLAAISGWSVAHLYAVFKQHLNQSPHQVLIDRRLRAARERLTLTSDPIKQISHDCGFSNASAMCRRFQMVMGVSPANYRRHHTQAGGQTRSNA